MPCGLDIWISSTSLGDGIEMSLLPMSLFPHPALCEGHTYLPLFDHKGALDYHTHEVKNLSIFGSDL